jgi:hypothetical protein
MFIGNPRDGIKCVDFRYENLPMFCFNCGLIGHNEDKCEMPTQIIPEGGANTRGPWLRSNIYGKRIHENRDRRFNSNPMQSMSGGKFSPIPQEMLDMMAKMKLEEEGENHSSNPDHTHSASKHQQSPTEIKRKFQKVMQSTQQITQNCTEISSPNSSNYSKVSHAEQANQGQ